MTLVCPLPLAVSDSDDCSPSFSSMSHTCRGPNTFFSRLRSFNFPMMLSKGAGYTSTGTPLIDSKLTKLTGHQYNHQIHTKCYYTTLLLQLQNTSSYIQNNTRARGNLNKNIQHLGTSHCSFQNQQLTEIIIFLT